MRARFSVALVALVGLLAGCSAPPAAEREPKPVKLFVTVQSPPSSVAHRVDGAAPVGSAAYIQIAFVEGRAETLEQVDRDRESRLLETPSLITKVGEPARVVVGDRPQTRLVDRNGELEEQQVLRDSIATDVTCTRLGDGSAALKLRAFVVKDGVVRWHATEELTLPLGETRLVPMKAVRND